MLPGIGYTPTPKHFVRFGDGFRVTGRFLKVCLITPNLVPISSEVKGLYTVHTYHGDLKLHLFRSIMLWETAILKSVPNELR